MRGDISRINLEQARRYSSVRMQQGRVQLDSDWNEQVDILDKLRRQLVRDVIGEACIPEDSESEGALEVTESDGELHVAPGRIWIDGVLCEVDTEQTIELPSDDGSYAVYLETWERCVTAVEDPSLLEVALGGPDTTTRTETLCEVGIIAMEGSECSDSWDPPVTTGSLTAFAADVAAEEPCSVPAASGYQRVENDLYRVEIHSAGNTANAVPPTFKWARHNASVLAAWLANDGSAVIIESLGPDEALSFAENRWIELSDDARDLAGEPGILAEVTGRGTDALGRARLEISIAGGDPLPDPATLSHPKIRRWDQDANVDAATGAVPIVPAIDVDLEAGVSVRFDAGDYREGDFWVIPARTFVGDFAGDIIWPRDAGGVPQPAPPHGIDRRFARLAVATVVAGDVTAIDDCRHLFPSLCELDEGCCTAIVEPGNDIQEAIDSLPEAGGCVCLKPGLHMIEEPIEITNSNITLHGETTGAVIRRENGFEMLVISGGAEQIRIETLTLLSRFNEEEGTEAVVRLFGVSQCYVSKCVISGTGRPQVAAIAIGQCFDISIDDNRIEEFQAAVVKLDASRVSIKDNNIEGGGGSAYAITVGNGSENVVAANHIAGFGRGVLLFTGATDSRITENTIDLRGVADDDGAFAIDVGGADCLVRDNVISLHQQFQGGIRIFANRVCADKNRIDGPRDDADQRPVGIIVGDEEFETEDVVVDSNLLAGLINGIVATSSDKIKILSNVIRDVSEIAIAVETGEFALVQGNDIEQTGTAVSLITIVQPTVADNRIRNCDTGIDVRTCIILTARGNIVQDARLNGYRGTFNALTRLADSRFANCAYGGDPSQPAIAIASGAELEVEIERCEVINTGIPPGASVAAVNQAIGIGMIFNLSCRIENNFVLAPANSPDGNRIHNALVLIGFLVFAQEVPNIVLDQTASIRGNEFSGPGLQALVFVPRISLTDGLALGYRLTRFSDNTCLHRPSTQQTPSATASLSGGRLIVQGNNIEPHGRPSFDLNNRPAIFIGNRAPGGVSNSGGARPNSPGHFDIFDFNF